MLWLEVTNEQLRGKMSEMKRVLTLGMMTEWLMKPQLVVQML